MGDGLFGGGNKFKEYIFSYIHYSSFLHQNACITTSVLHSEGLLKMGNMCQNIGDNHLFLLIIVISFFPNFQQMRFQMKA